MCDTKISVTAAEWTSQEKDHVNSCQEEIADLCVRVREQEQEILFLRKQIGQSYVKEMQLLSEKYALERRYSDVQFAMEEKQKESIASALNELAQRKGDVEENVRLSSYLKDADDERYIYNTSLLGLLAENGVCPNAVNATSITISVKDLYSQLLWKIRRIDGEDEHSHQQNYIHDNQVESPIPNDEGPGIEDFQIVGDARLGGKLLGCGYPFRGTSLCVFQWVRHLDDGTRQYIEGATNPEYVVTADDVDKCIAVECIPMDDRGRQGELVRRFANDHNKITCDLDMQSEIDGYLSRGLATFSVLMLMDSPDKWEPATIIVGRSGFQVENDKMEPYQIGEMFSKDLSIKIPYGLSAQFVLTCSDGSSIPFNAQNDIRMRDTLVLTMRIFQSKAMDEKRKERT